MNENMIRITPDKYRVAGIYQIINLMNNQIYIGSSIYIKSRWGLHKRHLKENKHHSKYLQRSWNKWGENNFILKVLEEIVNKDKLIEREQYFIDLLKPEYNTRKIAESNRGYKWSDESKLKMKFSSKNMKPEVRQKITNARNKIIQKPFLMFDKNNTFIREFLNLQEYYKFIGKKDGNVIAVLKGNPVNNGKSFSVRKTSNGYKFKYK